MCDVMVVNPWLGTADLVNIPGCYSVYRRILWTAVLYGRATIISQRDYLKINC